MRTHTSEPPINANTWEEYAKDEDEANAPKQTVYGAVRYIVKRDEPVYGKIKTHLDIPGELDTDVLRTTKQPIYGIVRNAPS
ncbi:hypothetical protein PV325_006418 [Microctonus aethiopoides]|nr:hypothetical protein PV325_006418 [Microctonus aethiopoides]